MTQAQQFTSGQPQIQDTRNRLNLPTDRRQSCLSELKSVVGEGAEAYVRVAKFSKEIAATVYQTMIKPHLGKCAALTTIGASMTTVGVAETALAVGGLAGAAGGVVALAAATGGAIRGFRLICGGGKAVIGKVAEVYADVKAGINAIRVGVKAAAAEARTVISANATNRMETKEKRVQSDVIEYLTRLIEKQTDTEAQSVISKVLEGAANIFELLDSRMSGIMKNAIISDVPVKEALTKVQSFMNHLKDELKENILNGFQNSTVENPMLELEDRLAELVQKVQAFEIKNRQISLNLPSVELISQPGEDVVGESSVNLDNALANGDSSASSTEDQAPEATGAANKAAATPSPYSNFFGTAYGPDEIKAALEGLTERSTMQEKKKAVALIQSTLSGVAVTLDQKDASVQAEVLKMASMPVDRKIPHFDDLYLKLNNSFPGKCRLAGGKIIITGHRGRKITLENRHPSQGGKVTVFFGNQDKGGMWNDNVEAVVEDFINKRTYPTLEIASTPEMKRVIATTRSSRYEATKLFQKLKNDFGQESFSQKGVRWHITTGSSVLYAERENAGDSRTWKITDKDKNEIRSGIAIKDLETEIKIARDATGIVSKLAVQNLDKPIRFILSNDSSIFAMKVTDHMDKGKAGQVAVSDGVVKEGRIRARTSPPLDLKGIHKAVFTVVRGAYEKKK